MDIQIRRCLYCGKKYQYLASGGYYCFNHLNDSRYCPRCKEIIDKALETNVPKNDMISHKPFPCDKFDDKLLSVMSSIRDNVRNDNTGKNHLLSKPLVDVDPSLDFDIVEKYRIERKIYYICYNGDRDNPDSERYYFIEREYCPSLGEVKGDYIDYDASQQKNSLTYGCNLHRAWMKMCEEHKETIKEWEALDGYVDEETYFSIK